MSVKPINYAQELNTEQLAVVESKPGPALVLAGAGSGKTRTLIYRLSWLIDNGFTKDRILLLTFTNKAAKEMLSRAEQLLAGSFGFAQDRRGGNKTFWGGTFHHIANRLLRKYHKLLNLKSNFTILDEEDSQSLIKAAIKELVGTKPKVKKPSPALVRDIISYSRNSGQTIQGAVEQKYPELIKELGFLEQVAAEYEKKKLASGSLDFDDMLIYWLRLLKNPQWRRVIAKHWDYILVDEYQDTNLIQDEIVRLLAHDHHNILVVGDDAQSIYSFRAARVDNILAFPKAFIGTKIFRLERNYRSTPEILLLANNVIAKNTRQFKKKLFTEEESFIKPELLVAQDPSEEAGWIAQRILALENDGVDLANIAVLFRAAHQSQELELQLNKRGIPYEMRGGLKFFERAHIKDMLSHLKLLANNQDEAAWRRVLLLQTGVGDVAAQKIVQQVKNYDTLEAALSAGLQLPAQANNAWRGLQRSLRKVLDNSREASVGKLIRLLLIDYGNYISAAYADYRQRLDDLEQFAVFADKYNDLNEFLAETSLQENYAIRGTDDSGHESNVVLSTVHQAKGLEWHAVFIMHVSDKSFPHPRAVREPGGIEEERRLFYVAITRAKRRLYLSYPVSNSSYSLNINQPSDFLREIRSELLTGDIADNENDIIELDSDGERSYLPSIDRL
ncbi:MAG: ATP-dependent helicase [Candidatus Komeilibacteria bacterium]